MAAEGRQQELERVNLEEIVTKIEADTVPAAESCGPRLRSPVHRCGPAVPTPMLMPSLANLEALAQGISRMRPPPRAPQPGCLGKWPTRALTSRDVSFKPTGAAS